MNMAWNFDKLLIPSEACKNGGYTASSLVINTALAFVLQGIDKYVVHLQVGPLTTTRLCGYVVIVILIFTENTYLNLHTYTPSHTLRQPPPTSYVCHYYKNHRISFDKPLPLPPSGFFRHLMFDRFPSSLTSFPPICLPSSRSSAARTKRGIVNVVHCLMLSMHCFRSLPRGRFPSTHRLSTNLVNSGCRNLENVVKL